MRKEFLAIGLLAGLLTCSTACTPLHTDPKGYGPPRPQELAVQICNESGDCWIFEDAPPCSEWALTSSTCTDIPLAITTLASGSSSAGLLNVQNRRSEIVLHVQGRQSLTKPVLDLKPLKEKSLVGVSARIATAPGDISNTEPSPSQASSRVLLDLVVGLFDQRTHREISRRNWLVDITDPSSVRPVDTPAQTPVTCPKGTYPPNCYPCLGCKPCPGRPGEYCDIVWNSIPNLRVNPDALTIDSYTLCDGRLQPRNK